MIPRPAGASGPRMPGKSGPSPGAFGPGFHHVKDISSPAFITGMNNLQVNTFQPPVFQQIAPQFANAHGECAAFQLGLIAGMNPVDEMNGEGQSHYKRPPWGGANMA